MSSCGHLDVQRVGDCGLSLDDKWSELHDLVVELGRAVGRGRSPINPDSGGALVDALAKNLEIDAVRNYNAALAALRVSRGAPLSSEAVHGFLATIQKCRDGYAEWLGVYGAREQEIEAIQRRVLAVDLHTPPPPPPADETHETGKTGKTGEMPGNDGSILYGSHVHAVSGWEGAAWEGAASWSQSRTVERGTGSAAGDGGGAPIPTDPFYSPSSRTPCRAPKHHGGDSVLFAGSFGHGGRPPTSAHGNAGPAKKPAAAQTLQDTSRTGSPGRVPGTKQRYLYHHSNSNSNRNPSNPEQRDGSTGKDGANTVQLPVLDGLCSTERLRHEQCLIDLSDCEPAQQKQSQPLHEALLIPQFSTNTYQYQGQNHQVAIPHHRTQARSSINNNHSNRQDAGQANDPPDEDRHPRHRVFATPEERAAAIAHYRRAVLGLGFGAAAAARQQPLPHIFRFGICYHPGFAFATRAAAAAAAVGDLVRAACPGVPAVVPGCRVVVFYGDAPVARCCRRRHLLLPPSGGDGAHRDDDHGSGSQKLTTATMTTTYHPLRDLLACIRRRLRRFSKTATSVAAGARPGTLRRVTLTPGTAALVEFADWRDAHACVASFGENSTAGNDHEHHSDHAHGLPTEKEEEEEGAGAERESIPWIRRVALAGTSTYPPPLTDPYFTSSLAATAGAGAGGRCGEEEEQQTRCLAAPGFPPDRLGELRSALRALVFPRRALCSGTAGPAWAEQFEDVFWVSFPSSRSSPASQPPPSATSSASSAVAAKSEAASQRDHQDGHGAAGIEETAESAKTLVLRFLKLEHAVRALAVLARRPRLAAGTAGGSTGGGGWVFASDPCMGSVEGEGEELVVGDSVLDQWIAEDAEAEAEAETRTDCPGVVRADDESGPAAVVGRDGAVAVAATGAGNIAAAKESPCCLIELDADNDVQGKSRRKCRAGAASRQARAAS